MTTEQSTSSIPATSRIPAAERINARASRARLPARNRPYWRLIAQGFHLGYRKGTRKASWMARLRHEGEGTQGYQTEAIGQADDSHPANGQDILTYSQALEKALAWRALVEDGAIAGEPDIAGLDATLTVARAVQTYIDKRNRRRSAQAGRTVNSDAQYKLTAHVLRDRHLPALALRDLAEADLIAWQTRLVAQAPASRQRIVNDLKAALNGAYAAHRRALPRDLPTVIRFGLQIEPGEVVAARARENQILPDETVRTIVEAAMALDEDFGRLVLLLAATGARFAQLRRMRVADVQADQQRLLVPQSFKGKRRQPEYIRVPVRADVIAALRPVLAGRDPSAPLLERWHLRQSGPRTWVRAARGEWKTPSEMTRAWTRVVAGLKLPAATIPYALRHSSIVRGLRANLPIRLVAALHDTSVGMIERHYSRWITEGLEEMVARAAVPLWNGAQRQGQGQATA